MDLFGGTIKWKKRVQPLMGGRLDSILRISATQSCFFSLNAAAQLRVVSWGQAKPVILKPRWTEASRGKLIKDYPCQGPIQYQFSCSVVSDSLWPHGLQHTRLPCPSPTPGACSNSCSLSRWCHPIISSSVGPFSSCLQFFPESH